MPIICNDVYDDEDYTSYFEQFGFELSPFQKHAIRGLVDGHHVLVCAPTGSGKTLPAEFAIRHFISQGKRVVYTSPIKALSNQKYHEFVRKFPEISVGLCTGDIKTNPTADLMIMTAEILNNALLNSGANSESEKTKATSLHFQMDVETELAVIIMDEVHYINDAARGHVWEQTIMNCPRGAQMLMLSATLDGPEEFAKWIESTNELQSAKWIESTNHSGKWIESTNHSGKSTQNSVRQVVLAQTHKRIVPLTHYAFIPYLESIPKIVKDKATVQQIAGATNKLLCLQSATGVFSDATYISIANTLKTLDKHDIRIHPKFVFNSLAKFMKGQEDPMVDDCLLPAIVFVLSRNQVERYAEEITGSLWPFDSKAPYTIAGECEQILRKLPNWREYVELPEYKTLVRNLEKGVATHHSGMIPVLREIVEILIGKKLVRLLFATESFAIGLDCPIRTAVFTSLSKYDGHENRLFYAHEYTQMAGRAGRRGIDVVGNVIHLPTMYTHKSELPSCREFREVLNNKPQKLVSKFHIDYSMVLDSIRETNTTQHAVESEMQVRLDPNVSGILRLAQKSMISDELRKSVEAAKREYEASQKRYEAKCESVKFSLRTPEDVCRNYLALKYALPLQVNKKRKETERALKTLEERHKWIRDDADMVQDMDELRGDCEFEKQRVEGAEQWLKNQVEMVVDVLKSDGFLNENGVTAMGWVASQIREIHPLVVSRCIFLWGLDTDANEFDTVRLIGLMSVFSPVRSGTSEEERTSEPRCRDAWLNERLKQLRGMYELYGDTERRLQMDTGIEYEGALGFDMVDTMMDWAKLRDGADQELCSRSLPKTQHEVQRHPSAKLRDGEITPEEYETRCRLFLQTELPVSLGDFIKTVLKISAIAKEWRAMALNAGFVQFAANLELVDGLILKSVATTQSLYV